MVSACDPERCPLFQRFGGANPVDIRARNSLGGGLALVVNTLFGVIIFTHVLKPLTLRNENRSLAANWAIFAMCLWLMILSMPSVLLTFAMPPTCPLGLDARRERMGDGGNGVGYDQ
ncbi:MAG UNVERIFIED_CONTAM: hypothetical protein LVT10_18600 [Anaerolineae bacterium]